MLEALDRTQTALLVIDLQNAFVHAEGTLGASGVDLGDTAPVLARVARLVETCRAHDVPVIWTRHVHLPGDVRRAAKRLAPHTARRRTVAALSGTWDAELVDEIAPLADDPTHIVVKHRFGSFYETRLEALLAALGVRALLVAGATANACVETTMREAYMRDYDVVAVTDCITTIDDGWKRVTHAIWSHYLGELATADEIAGWLGTPAPSEGVLKERA